jgi:hypothetical protein
MNNDTPKTNAVIASKDEYDSFDGWLDALQDHAKALELENAKLREVGWTVARTLESARWHGYCGGTELLTQWAALAGSDLTSE